jgi:RNA polymerase sigma-70 factor (ECF subfamily)
MSVALTVDDALQWEVPAAREELDVDTIEACRRGDPVALRQFVTTYQRPVFAFLSRALGAGTHVEDLAQEVFLRAYRALPRFEPDGPARLSTWLLTIARSVAMDARKRRRLRVVPLREGREVSDASTPETERRRREIARAFERAAAQLSVEQRDVFVLAQFHGLSMAEIAGMLSIPENTVRTRLFRARERLRALLREVREA